MKNIPLFVIILMSGMVIYFDARQLIEIRSKPSKPHNYTVHMKSGVRSSVLHCDSVQMMSSEMADVWVDGQRMRIYSREPILIEQNK